MVDVGKLDKRITFLAIAPVEDAMHQSKMQWTPVHTVWATVKPYKSSEAAFMSKRKPEVTHRFYVRYRKDLTADMRIRYGERLFEIAGPPLDIDEKHELLEIQAEEVFERAKY